jgi:hypothetical protein
MDKKLAIWDVESETIKFNITLTSMILQIDWSAQNTDRLLLLLQTSELKMLDLKTKSMLNLEIGQQESPPTVMRWSPKRPGVAAIGFKSGRVTFIDVHSLKTFTIEIKSPKEDPEGEDPISI